MQRVLFSLLIVLTCAAGLAYAYASRLGTSGSFVFISTQTAHHSASLQFTNLPASYNTLFLNCEGLLAAVTLNKGLGTNILVSEGKGWKVGSYTTEGEYMQNGSQTTWGSTSGTDFLDNTLTLSGSIPTSIKFYIGNVGSSTVYKMASYQGISGGGSKLNPFAFTGGGYWNNDTKPITALGIVPGTSAIASGTCSLYGMN